MRRRRSGAKKSEGRDRRRGQEIVDIFNYCFVGLNELIVVRRRHVKCATVRSRVDDSYRVQFSQPRSSRADVSEALTPVALCAWQLKGSTIPTDFRISSSSPSVSRLSEWYIVSIGSENPCARNFSERGLG